MNAAATNPRVLRLGIPRLFAILSGLLLFAAFPPLAWSALAWLALIPLLLAVAELDARQAWKMGLIAGLAFWWPSLAWLAHVTWTGWIMLGIYCALFFACFVLFASFLLRCRKLVSNPMPAVGIMLMIPAGWVSLEYIRSTLFTGFPWNALGCSQALSPALIQTAEWGGAYLVSYLVVFFNTGLTLAILVHQESGASMKNIRHVRVCIPLLLAMFVFLLNWVQGRHVLAHCSTLTGSELNLALIQLNVPQTEKMEEQYFEGIEDRLRESTRNAIQLYKPDLVVWPETAVPTFVRGVPSTEALIAELLELNVPLLVGTMDLDERNGHLIFFNSSFLFDPKAGQVETYNKQHLVCFGEYVPLDDVLPFLRHLTPIEESFQAGKRQTVFRLLEPTCAFSVLICFEDTVATLGRAAVRAGARLLINQTNDAWFDPSWASRQHMLQCVLRCVENRVPAARAANTGITCAIDACGRVVAELPRSRDTNSDCLNITLRVPGAKKIFTFYTRHGDVFALTCLGLTIFLSAALLFFGLPRKKL